MAYILSRDLPDPTSHLYYERQREQWQLYRHYLQELEQKFPSATREFALADWHYNPDDSRCPHDSWLESLAVRESTDTPEKKQRHITIQVRLLGAYHDGHIKLTYHRVLSYTFNNPATNGRAPYAQHGDWLMDEVRLSTHGTVIHEIEWENGARWIVECDDIAYVWVPIAQ